MATFTTRPVTRTTRSITMRNVKGNVRDRSRLVWIVERDGRDVGFEFKSQALAKAYIDRYTASFR